MSGLFVNGASVSQELFDRHALDPAHSVIIEACAGSGKTWLLVGRLLRLLLDGTEPGQILAITFTHKAADEVRERLYKVLEQCAIDADEVVLAMLVARGMTARESGVALPRARKLLERVLTSATPMTIDTFHGWFARIVRGAPLRSGISSEFSLIERPRSVWSIGRRRFLAELDRDAALKATFSALLDDVGEFNAWALLDAVRKRRNEWAAFAGTRSADELTQMLAGDVGVDVTVDPRAALLADTHFAPRYRALAAVLIEGGALESEGARLGLEALDAIERDPNDRDAFFALRFLVTNKTPPFALRKMTKGVAKQLEDRGGASAPLAFGQEMERLRDDILQASEHAIEHDVVAINQRLYTLAIALLNADAAVRQGESSLDFDDLEWFAARLAADGEHAAYIQTRLDARYRHVLVDEFQDTNPLQWSVLRNWLDAYGADASAPTVFLVGDPKQSIYRFRRADARLFGIASQFLAERFDAHLLRTNVTRRCASAIVEALNGSFADGQYTAFAAHVTLNAERGRVMRLPLIEHIGRVAGDADVDAPLRDPLHEALVSEDVVKRDLEAQAIAQVIASLVGREEIHARSEADPIARYRDVLVLVRQRVSIAYLERAFRARGIPYSSDRKGGLLASLEALDIGALLRFLVLPFSNHLLAHILKSPIFSCDDDDLIALSIAPGGARWLDRMAALSDRAGVARAWRLLGNWIALAGRVPVHDLLDRVISEGDLIQRYASAVPSGADASAARQARANLLAFVELSLTLEGGRYPSLSRFLSELEDLATGAEVESPDEGVIDFGDTVRILTIHGAKGLEAPIVVLADACFSEKTAVNDALIEWPPGEDAPTHFSLFGSVANRGLGRASIFDREQELARQERFNLLYVAMTRAQDILVVSGVAPARKMPEDDWYTRIERVTPVAAVLPDDARAVGHAAIAVSFDIEDFVPPRMSSGTRVAAALPDAAALARLKRGIVLHQVLERMAGERADALRARSIAMEFLEPEQAHEVANVALGILSAVHLQRFFDPASYLSGRSELELMTDQGDWLRIDRLVEFEDEIWILDYKYQTRPEVPAGYAQQLLRYRDAVQSLGSGKLVRTALILADATLLET